MYEFKKKTVKFLRQCGYALTCPAVLLYKGLDFLDKIGIGGFFSGILLLWCISQVVQGIRRGESIFLSLVVYFLIFGIIGSLGASILEFALHLFLNALQPICNTNANLKRRIKDSSNPTLEDYIHMMRNKTAYDVKKVGC